MTKRVEYLDIAKGLGIMMVVWGHIMHSGWSYDLVYAFHMPLFFFLSGMLFQRGKYISFLDFLRKRTRRLFVPYLIYSIITWSFWVGYNMFRHNYVGSYWNPLLQTIIAKGSGEFMPHNSALWFIPCLFAVEIIYYMTSKFKDVVNILFCFSLAFVSIILAHVFGGDWLFLLPWNFDAALIAIPFYCTGNLLIKHYSFDRIRDAVKNNVTISIVLWGGLTVLLVLGTFLFGTCSMGSSWYGCNEWVFILRAFVGIAATLVFSILLSSYSINYIKWLGRTSLDVMCVHIPVKGVVIVAITALFHPSVPVDKSISWAFLAFVATMLIVSAIVWIIDGYIRPYFKNKITVK